MRRPISAMLAVLLLAVAAGPAAADSLTPAPGITADLEGTPIPVAEIALHHCHDRAFPHIECYTTRAEVERALVVDRMAPASLAEAASDYVVVWASTSYRGATLTISQDYSTLAVVGWNDRIRSYKGLNGASGTFYVDWFAGGDDLVFCCNVQDPSLPAAFDLRITSVYRN